MSLRIAGSPSSLWSPSPAFSALPFTIGISSPGNLYLIRELLTKYKFPGDDIPIVKGSALKAGEGDQSELGEPAILKLIEALDSYIPEPVRQKDKPFLMA